MASRTRSRSKPAEPAVEQPDFRERHHSINIRLDQIRSSEINPRKRFDEAALQELAESIRQHGVLQPIGIRPALAGRARWQIVWGERRWRAAKIAGLTHLPAVLLRDIDDVRHLRLGIIENVQREDLDPIEEAIAYRRLAELGMKQAAIAASVNRSQPTIANALRLLELPADVQERISAGQLNGSHGIALASLKAFPGVVSLLAEDAVTNHRTAHDLEKPLQSYFIVDELKKRKLAVVVSSADTLFNREVCQQCPFGAARTVQYSTLLCLRPEHYAELQAEAQATRRKAMEEVQAQAREALAQQGAGALAVDDGAPPATNGAGGAADAPTMPQLRDLDHRGYERISEFSTTPEGCTPACPCRAAALAYDGETVPICIDPKRFSTLLGGQTKRANKARRAHLLELSAQIVAAIDALSEIGPAEAALLAGGLIDWYGGKRTDAVAARHGVELPDSNRFGGVGHLATLAALPPLTAIKLAIESTLTSELAKATNPMCGYSSARAEWYLQQINALRRPERPAAAHEGAMAGDDASLGSPTTDLRATGAGPLCESPACQCPACFDKEPSPWRCGECQCHAGIPDCKLCDADLAALPAVPGVKA